MRAKGEELVLEALQQRMEGYGNGLSLAKELGTSPTYLRNVKGGVQPLTVRIARAVGFELRWVKVEKDVLR